MYFQSTQHARACAKEYTFAVVEFVNEDTVQVVVNSWLEGNICYWPDSMTDYDRKKAIEMEVTPDLDSWSAHEVTVKYRSDDVTRARFKCGELTKNDDVTQTVTEVSDDEVPRKRTRKSKPKMPYRYQDPMKNWVSDQEERTPIVTLNLNPFSKSLPKAIHNGTPQPLNHISPTNKAATNKIPSNKTPTNKPATNKTSTNKTPTNKPATNKTLAYKPPTNKTPTNNTPTIKTPTNNTPTNRTQATNRTPTNKTPTNNLTQAHCQQTAGLPTQPQPSCVNCLRKDSTSARMFGELEGLKLKLNQIHTLLQTLVQQQNLQQPQAVPTNVGPTAAELGLPLKTLQDLMGLECLLNNRRTEMSNRVRFLGSLGGKDVPSIVRKVLTTLVSDKLAETLNWVGREKTSIQTFPQVLLLIIVSVRQHEIATAVPQAAIENIKPWLRGAADRNGGRARRETRLARLTKGTPTQGLALVRDYNSDSSVSQEDFQGRRENPEKDEREYSEEDEREDAEDDKSEDTETLMELNLPEMNELPVEERVVRSRFCYRDENESDESSLGEELRQFEFADL